MSLFVGVASKLFFGGSDDGSHFSGWNNLGVRTESEGFMQTVSQFGSGIFREIPFSVDPKQVVIPESLNGQA